MLNLRRVEPVALPPIGAYADQMVYHTPEWMAFISKTQGAKPVLAEVCEGNSVVGHLYGLVFRRYGLRLFGSPFPGWTTSYMGFCLQPGVPRLEALRLVPDFVFEELRCVHLELVDRRLSESDIQELGLDHTFDETYETDLRQSEDNLLSHMKKSCRWGIRKAARNGVVIEEASGTDESFADQYFDQLRDVFAKQDLAPTYGIDRVKRLIEFLHPTGNLLLLRARDPEGTCIATGIYLGLNRRAIFWGNASYRWGQRLLPNEPLHWHAMRYWKGRGMHVFDWGGGGTYKEKYGCIPVTVPRVLISKHEVLRRLRDAAQKMFRVRQRLRRILGPS